MQLTTTTPFGLCLTRFAVGHLRPLMMELVLVAMCIYFALEEPRFFTVENGLLILRDISEQGLIAFGMTMVIIAGEIDLSVGSLVALSGCVVAGSRKSACPCRWGS